MYVATCGVRETSSVHEHTYVSKEWNTSHSPGHSNQLDVLYVVVITVGGQVTGYVRTVLQFD